LGGVEDCEDPNKHQCVPVDCKQSNDPSRESSITDALIMVLREDGVEEERRLQ
jgi:hypothetical protein